MPVDEAILGKAVDLLARREHSRCELRNKLRSRGLDADGIDEALDALEERGWLSDERFAEGYVRSRRERGDGPLRIARALRDRGVSDEVAGRCLGGDAMDWDGAARRAWEKRFGGHPPDGIEDRARQQRFLLRRGFDHEQIRTLFRDLETEAGSNRWPNGPCPPEPGTGTGFEEP